MMMREIFYASGNMAAILTGAAQWLAIGLIYAMLPQPDDRNKLTTLPRPIAKLTDENRSPDDTMSAKRSPDGYIHEDVVLFLSFPDHEVAPVPLTTEKTRLPKITEEHVLLESRLNEYLT
ncbi:hypothetical protein MPTK1_7g05550 [Marchantia polymorpha subsp. ruderalis]|uniref:Uncharacterized protein n=2 Tax=Marchantia polymorpha TaxID=3197 RepID=A0AAF6BWF7_MARPO|nr:hypothetical protein MARPO_0057s0115 [Marchantia polymorpha]BBN16341.1 hypothetical protein Mp_7g05550 [Marchantia polymorpha subsp. ruderalis]|eukprot:PTQ37514.1 hypothetical protein MARPO_0057s0115 [Marchantia polymorpha]